jgi:hypothetical protein
MHERKIKIKVGTRDQERYHTKEGRIWEEIEKAEKLWEERQMERFGC